MHEFLARGKLMQAKFVLVKLCTSSFEKLRASEIHSMCYPRNGLYSKIRASEILSMCYPRNGVYLKIRASEIRTSEIRASQGPPVV